MEVTGGRGWPKSAGRARFQARQRMLRRASLLAKLVAGERSGGGRGGGGSSVMQWGVVAWQCTLNSHFHHYGFLELEDEVL